MQVLPMLLLLTEKWFSYDSDSVYSSLRRRDSAYAVNEAEAKRPTCKDRWSIVSLMLLPLSTSFPRSREPDLSMACSSSLHSVDFG